MKYWVMQDTDGAFVLWKFKEGEYPIGSLVYESPEVDEEAKVCSFNGDSYRINIDGTLHLLDKEITMEKKTTREEIIKDLNRQYKRAVMDYQEKVEDNGGDGFHKDCLWAKCRMETIEQILMIHDKGGAWDK